MRFPEDVLPDRQRDALHRSAAVLIDDALDAQASEAGLATSTIAMFLPRYLAHTYTESIYRKMLVAVIGLGAQLAVTDDVKLKSTGDELAFDAIIRQADELLVEIDGGRPGNWARYADAIYGDTGLILLDDAGADGFDEPGADPAATERAGNRDPGDWFKPFDPDDPVHPYIAEFQDGSR